MATQAEVCAVTCGIPDMLHPHMIRCGELRAVHLRLALFMPNEWAICSHIVFCPGSKNPNAGVSSLMTNSCSDYAQIVGGSISSTMSKVFPKVRRFFFCWENHQSNENLPPSPQVSEKVRVFLWNKLQMRYESWYCLMELEILRPTIHKLKQKFAEKPENS